MYLVYAQINFSNIILLVLPLCCSPPERNLRAESRFVQSVFGKETVTSAGQLARGSWQTCRRPCFLQAL